MRTALIVVDDVASPETALRPLMRDIRRGQPVSVHLLNVQPPLGGYISRMVGSRAVRNFQRDRGERTLGNARRLLDRAAIDYTAHIRVGDASLIVAQAANELRAQDIVLSAAGGLLGNLTVWLLASRIRRYASVPVVVVISPAPSAWSDRRSATYAG
jgi:nucleotide-binding universal stress UspA family protein